MIARVFFTALIAFATLACSSDSSTSDAPPRADARLPTIDAGSTPDAAPALCAELCTKCGECDCPRTLGDCSPAQQAMVTDCVRMTSCGAVTIQVCYDQAGCALGATPSVCGNGTCEADEVGLCPDDCPPPACAHDECTTGTPLAASCTMCTALVCENDDYCCTNGWDENCVTIAQTVCGLCL